MLKRFQCALKHCVFRTLYIDQNQSALSFKRIAEHAVERQHGHLRDIAFGNARPPINQGGTCPPLICRTFASAPSATGNISAYSAQPFS